MNNFEKMPTTTPTPEKKDSVPEEENKELNKEDFKSELAKESYEKVESTLKDRNSIAEEILKDKNEDGSVDIDDLNLNESEVAVFLEKIQRNSDEILEDLKSDLSNASEGEIQEAIEQVGEINNDKNSVKEAIKNSVLVSRSQESVKDSKQNLGATIKDMEHLLSDKVSEIIESDLDRAVKLKGFSSDLNLLSSRVENLPFAQGLISGGIDKLQEYEEKVLQLQSNVDKIKNDTEILLKNMNQDTDIEEFDNKTEELGKIVDNIKENIDNLGI